MTTQRTIRRSKPRPARSRGEWPLIDAIAAELRALRGGTARPDDNHIARRLLQSASCSPFSTSKRIETRLWFPSRMAG
jgi:hypothetical protein